MGMSVITEKANQITLKKIIVVLDIC